MKVRPPRFENLEPGRAKFAEFSETPLALSSMPSGRKSRTGASGRSFGIADSGAPRRFAVLSR